MKTNSFHVLKNLLINLKSEEIKSIRRLLKNVRRIKEKPDNKCIQLINKILKYPNSTEATISNKIYKNSNRTAFNTLVSRTKEKVYEIIMSDSNLNLEHYNVRDRSMFDLKKKINLVTLLFSRQILDDIENILGKIIQHVKRFEAYGIIAEALMIRQRNLGYFHGSGMFERIEKQIVHYEDLMHKTLRARRIYNRYASKINFDVDSASYHRELEDDIRKLGLDFQKTSSATIGYYYYFLLTQALQIRERYGLAESALKKLKELLEKNPSIYYKERMGEILLNLANNELLIFEFRKALENSFLAHNYFEKGKINYQVCREILFYSLYYLGRIDDAEEVIEELYETSRLSNSPFLFGRRAYLLACVKTIKGDIQASNSLLVDMKEIEKHKSGWNIAKRMLIIINRIEIEDFESVDLHVQNLQKFIKRNLKIKGVMKRDLIILRILLKLINSGYDFKKTYQSRQRYFELLSGDSEEYCWKIKSPELIVFQDWFKAKMEKRPYVFKIPVAAKNQIKSRANKDFTAAL